ncbi:AMP-binding protein [Streptomyces mirabilis]|uniref:AMP-binding protein n=1 Tax=Streptomyces mirabilis TaxID=68239 RepID=UPI0036BE3A7F
MHLGWQAKQRPDAIAVIESGGRTVTYAELDARSRQPAVALGLRPGDTLAIRKPSGAAFLEVAWAARRARDLSRLRVVHECYSGTEAYGSSRWSSRPPPT